MPSVNARLSSSSVNAPTRFSLCDEMLEMMTEPNGPLIMAPSMMRENGR